MTQNPKPPQNRIQIEIPSNLQAVYSNFAIIAHTPNEFFVDFAQLLPGLKKTQVSTRIVMSPSHAKLLYKALGENIDRYETQHGAITLPPMPPTLAEQLFGGVKPSDTNNEQPTGDDE